MFDLAADPVAIAEHLAKDRDLAPLVAKRPGLRAPGAWDGFELAIRAILGQQITVVAARGLAAKLVAGYGEPLSENLALEGVTHVFPTPQQLVAADFAALGMPRSRAAALAAMTDAVAADPPDLRSQAHLGRRHHRAESPARHRRMDGAVHRHARTA